ncbi:MAG: cell envelope integrity protein CreD [Chitinophagaceae bacterium]|nr:cell envelope integrity protein CreD [Chitinophagaceae bacterium]
MKVQDQLKGINEDIRVSWNDSFLVFNPQAAGQTPMDEALVTAVPLSAESAGKAIRFNMKFSVNGSGQLLFAAAARENRIEMKSSWPNPSFTGIKLPDTREVKDSGFVAVWRYMNRAMPQVSAGAMYNFSTSLMGADLLIPVDSYDKTERSVKYALLCIVLTFASFFLVESIYKKPLHLVQYGLAGLALILFYTLLLSISEYTGYNLAYLIAGVATIGLVAWYTGSILKSAKIALFISFVLTVVYGYVFSIIQLQDYALLMGSIGLFVALAVIMYFSRKLDW